ncbi:MAG: hypothetical protein GX799_00135 [Crenarchaeota archaeon]|nr:hypothetical protein [Thermoproteota archaeon]
MFASTYESECIFGDEIGPYLPSTENFSELKFELLTTGMKLLSRVYFPSLRFALARLINEPNGVNGELDKLTTMINSELATRNNQYYFFIVNSLIGSKKNITLLCKCGTVTLWKPPHKNEDMLCKVCGSTFNFIVIDGDPGYIFTSQGHVKAIGSSAPNLGDLPEDKFKEVWAKWREEMEKKHPNKTI